MKTSAALLAVALAAAPLAVHAQASDPAAQTIDRFNATLVESMKGGKSLGAQGRFRKMEPAVDQAFDIPTMTRVAIGPDWNTIAPADQSALVKAFGRVSAANFAHNFDDYSGEKFVIGKVDTRLPDKLVRTQVVTPGQASVDLNWRMRQSGGQWKVVDVMFGAISQITAQRSDYASTLKSGGAKALIGKMNDQADRLLK